MREGGILNYKFSGTNKLRKVNLRRGYLNKLLLTTDNVGRTGLNVAAEFCKLEFLQEM